MEEARFKPLALIGRWLLAGDAVRRDGRTGGRTGTRWLPQQQSIVQLLRLGNTGLHSEHVPHCSPCRTFLELQPKLLDRGPRV